MQNKITNKNVLIFIKTVKISACFLSMIADNCTWINTVSRVGSERKGKGHVII